MATEVDIVEDNLKDFHGNTPSAAEEELFYRLDRIERVQSELLDITRSVQRAIAATRSDIQDFRAEYSEEIAEVKRELQKQKLHRNKVWI